MVMRKQTPRYAADQHIIELELENQRLREEIRVTHEAAELTAQLVIEQFEHNESIKGELRTTSYRLQAVLDAASQVAIIATDQQGLVSLCNRGAERMLGCGLGSLAEHKRMSDLLIAVSGLEDMSDYHLADLSVHCSSETCEAVMRRSNGDTFPVNLAVTSLHDGEGQTYGYLTVAMDITTLKQAEAQLQKSYEELQAANKYLRELDKMKSDFLSSVSHELRTPLTSIRGFAKLIGRDLERSFLPIISNDAKLQRKAERINENLNIILSESERLTRLINDVLDLAKIESGRITWNDEALDLAGLIQQALHAVQGEFEAKPEVKLLTDISGKLPKVICDRDRFIQVLVNLLNNAAKFTEQGHVTLRAGSDGRGWASIQVIDTGIGFNPAEAEIIFDKFKQASQGNTLTDKPKGTGLGLSISREIVRHYNGDITTTSELGVGSTFTITLPSAELSDADEKEFPMEAFSDTTAPLILAVDDDQAVCRYLTQLFQENHYRVITANNGKTALENAHTHHPDLIIMDLAMPIMDGREAIELLRADPLLNAIPVIVVTAMPNKETPGADVAFSKPIDEDQLLSGVRLLLGSTGKSPAELRCLVVYDTPEPPERTPEIFDHIDYCPFDCLQERIEQGYKGIVMLPSYLLKKIDLDALQGRSENQIMILPVDGLLIVKKPVNSKEV